MDEKKLWKYIQKNTKASFQAVYDDNNKLLDIIANKGLDEGQIAVRGSGEYDGFSIRALENIKPILTDSRVSRAVKFLSDGDIQSAVAVLRIVEETREQGLGFMYYVLKTWLEKNEIPVPEEYNKKAVAIKSQKVLDWILSGSFSPVIGKFEIYDTGITKMGTPVVPESWIGRVYDNADDLHEDMDKLDWRKGKSPVNFCCIYAMFIEKQTKNWRDIDNEMYQLNVTVGVSMFPKIRNGGLMALNSDVQFFADKKTYGLWLNGMPAGAKVLVAGLSEYPGKKLLIACDVDNIIERNPEYSKTKTTGLLVSTLQKLIRRGRGCSGVLKTTLEQLWKSPNYNLPEQQFLRVSSCRQLAWRLFITTIEDVEAYADSGNDYLSMCDLACLAVLADTYNDAQFTKPVFEKLLLTALLIQHHDQVGTNWVVHKLPDSSLEREIDKVKVDSALLKSFQLLVKYMPMRQGDFMMLNRSFNYIYSKRFVPKQLEVLDMAGLLGYGDKKEAIRGEMAGHDMAPHPNMLIDMQSALPFVPYNYDLHTTKALSEFIWVNSSVLNTRNPREKEYNTEEKSMLVTLENIQKYLVNKKYYSINVEKFKISGHNKYVNDRSPVPKTVSRLGFLLLFGQKMSIVANKKRYDIIVAGTPEEPCKVKSVFKEESNYLENPERADAEMVFIEYLKNNKVEIDCPKPPVGYRWIWGQKKHVVLSADIVKGKIIFFVDGHKLPPFDSSSVLEKLPKVTYVSNDKITKVIKQALYYPDAYDYDDYEVNLVMKKLSELMLPTVDWYGIAAKSKIPAMVWKCIVVKCFNNYNSEVQVGPVDGMGNKLHDSINYLYEGTVLRLFNMLSMIYPRTVIVRTNLKFFINTESAEYQDMIEKLKLLAFPKTKVNVGTQKLPKSIVIKTKLWDHQKKTSEKILNEILVNHKLGFGDASNVGAGKTLTALSIIAGLYNYNMRHGLLNYMGFLILLPTTYLYNTWLDEIRKHTSNIDTVLQNADGTLTGEIKHNTVLITTLGRMRDHPLSIPWIFVVVDECLSVQNKNALQTEEAWRQIICSQYRCVLLSATFFRSRFDKLFYMLKMLDTGLPENKSYLDTILCEHIVSYLPTKTTEWNAHVNRFQLDGALRKQYDQLLRLELNSEKLYGKLSTFLYDHFDYVGAFRKIVKSAEKKDLRCLLYARSKDEADRLAQIDKVSRFPDISGTHVVLSYTEGTYGLNNLVHLNVLVTRPPEPDKLPQMKGRLDRPGQKAKYLYIEYLVVDNTVEEALLFRLELANSFFNNYILPLADFYDIAVGRKNTKKLSHTPQP
jgi:hypothetical protein